MHYGYVVKIADSIIDLIYEYMSIEYLYMITQKGNLCKIAINKIIFSNETIYIPRQDSVYVIYVFFLKKTLKLYRQKKFKFILHHVELTKIYVYTINNILRTSCKS